MLNATGSLWAQRLGGVALAAAVELDRLRGDGPVRGDPATVARFLDALAESVRENVRAGEGDPTVAGLLCDLCPGGPYAEVGDVAEAYRGLLREWRVALDAPSASAINALRDYSLSVHRRLLAEVLRSSEER